MTSVTNIAQVCCVMKNQHHHQVNIKSYVMAIGCVKYRFYIFKYCAVYGLDAARAWVDWSVCRSKERDYAT